MFEDYLPIALALLLAACCGAIVVLARGRRSSEQPSIPARAARQAVARDAYPAGVRGQAADDIPWEDPAIDELTKAVHRHAFGVSKLHAFPILAEHAEVLERATRELRDVAKRREYFPRKPQVVPRLLAAMRNNESSLKELVDIIMQDPVMTGDVIRMANSAYYRISREPVETIGRAIVTLGTVGLRALVADSVMQPVFQVPRGYFEDFSPTVWRQAQHAAAAAQSYARATRSSDSFSAHLLALLFHMSHIVIFRVTVATYLGAKGALPRAEVFARLIDERSAQLACAIAREWDLPDTLVAALEEQVEQRAIGQLTPLALALYVGRICGAAIIATEDGAIGEAAVLELLERKHLPTDVAKTVWDSTRAFSRTDD